MGTTDLVVLGIIAVVIWQGVSRSGWSAARGAGRALRWVGGPTTLIVVLGATCVALYAWARSEKVRADRLQVRMEAGTNGNELGALKQWNSCLSDVYHDNPACTTGNNIEARNIRVGAGGKRLCEECRRLDGE